MGLLGDVSQLAGVLLIGFGVVYAYNRGVFDQILKKPEEEPKEEPKEEPEPVAKEEPKTKPKEDIEQIIEAAKPKPVVKTPSKYEKCRDTCYAKCTKAPTGPCKEKCRAGCAHLQAKLALAYAGSYYDGQFMDTAYYVTSSSLVPTRTRGRNDIPMRVAIA